MEKSVKNQRKPIAKAKESFGGCESCEFYDEGDDEIGEGCRLNLDEDEYAAYVITAGGGHSSHCPYYRRYDEYRTVRKQI